MKYSAFEQAALEASAGLREIDAEIERLKAKKEALELLQASARQLLASEPAKVETFPAIEATPAPKAVYESPFEQPAYAHRAPEPVAPSSAKEEWTAFMRNTGTGGK